MYTSKKIDFNIRQKSKNEIKYTKCLTDRTFFNKINNDLQQLVKYFFFTDVCYKRTWRLIV